MASEFFRELHIWVYGAEPIKKVDDLRKAGIDLTDLVIDAIMRADIKKLKQEKKQRLASIK